MNKKILVLLAVTGIVSISGMAFAQTSSDEVNSDEVKRTVPSWEKNMLNHDNDPTTKAGYGCQHGKMNRSCPNPVV